MIKYNLKNRSKAIKGKRKTRIKMLTKSNKTTLKWREILMEICTQKKNKEITKKGRNKKQISKWVLLTTNRDKTI